MTEGKLRRRKRGELELIAMIRERALRQGRGKSTILRLGIGDDCAVLRPLPGEDLVVTTDLSLERVHFRRDWHPPESAGHRCLARGLSDVAAMGARPQAAFLSLAVPRELSGRWVERFLDGFMLLAERHGVPLAGGDTAESPSLAEKPGSGLVTADILLLGSVPSGKALLRSGARAGDILYVTGELGGAAAELRRIRDLHHERPSAKIKVGKGPHPHFYPDPRLAVGRELVRRGMATAAIDLSDGLSTDLGHLCEESRLSALVRLQALPIAPQATLEEALHGGEDYELLFTAPPAAAVPATLGGVQVRAIGSMKRRNSRRPIEMLTEDGRRIPLERHGWEHFRSSGKG
ncbi:MAG TPA: thiamine-phosphate kinase [Acidobacteriaceae bacterium]|nr:thiamine-phosphate kinase [Acidobacteriaceae bacterium]